MVSIEKQKNGICAPMVGYSNAQDVRIAIRINRNQHVQRIMTEEGNKPAQVSETRRATAADYG